MEKDNTGKYAELLNQYAEHIFNEDVLKSEKRFMFTTPDGVKREIDLFVSLKNGKHIAFEVRDRHSTQSIEWIDQIVGKYIGTDINEIWVCTFDGCQLSNNAIQKMNYYNIKWRRFYLLKEGDKELQHPFVWLPCISIDKGQIQLSVDDEPYKDLMISNGPTGHPSSYINDRISELYRYISNDFQLFAGKEYADFNDSYTGEAIQQCFNVSKIEVHCHIPLNHLTFVDYYQEEYNVYSHDASNLLLVSTENTVFISDNKLIINLEKLEQMSSSDALITGPLLISIEEIPEKYKPIKNVQFIHSNGVSKVVPMQIYGIKESTSFK